MDDDKREEGELPKKEALLDKMLDHDAFSPHVSFKKKQKIVTTSLVLCAVLVTLIVSMSLLIVGFQAYKGNPADPNVVSLMSTALWILALFASTVISATVFNNVQDMNGLRSSVLELVGKLK